jgi:hypothetical protein
MEEASSVLLRIDGGRGELLEHVLGRRAPLLLRTNRAPGINQAPCTDGGVSTSSSTTPTCRQALLLR